MGYKSSYLYPHPDAPYGFDAVFALAESREAEVAFAAGAEAYARCADYVYLYSSCSKNARNPCYRVFQPNVGRIDSAIDLESGRLQAFAHDACVFHIIVDGGFHLRLAFRRINGFRSALGDVTRAVELGALTAVP